MQKSWLILQPWKNLLFPTGGNVTLNDCLATPSILGEKNQNFVISFYFIFVKQDLLW